MSTIANAKVEHNYNRYNGYFFGCLHFFYFRKYIALIARISQLVDFQGVPV